MSHDARSPDLFELEDDGEEHWRVTQRLKDPAGDLDWVVEGEVDLAASTEAGTAVLRLVEIRREGEILAEKEKKPPADIPDEDDLWAAYEEEEYEEEYEEEEEEK